MAEHTDYTEAGEIFRKSMMDALAHLESIADEAHKAHEIAIENQVAAKEELQRIEREAHLISEKYLEANKKDIEDRIRGEVLFEIAKNMIREGCTATQIYKWLKIPQKMLADAWMELGFEPLVNHVANVGYVDQGRAGEVIFYREDVVLRFPYEFGGGNTLAIIYVPKAENWQSETGLLPDERKPILEFIAQRVIRDQAQGYRYVIADDTIEISQ